MSSVIISDITALNSSNPIIKIYGQLKKYDITIQKRGLTNIGLVRRNLVQPLGLHIQKFRCKQLIYI